MRYFLRIMVPFVAFVLLPFVLVITTIRGSIQDVVATGLVEGFYLSGLTSKTIRKRMKDLDETCWKSKAVHA